MKLDLGFVQNLPSFVGVGKWLSDITRHDWSVVEQVQQSAAVPGENDLLLGSFDGGGKVEVVGLLNLLSGLSLVSRYIRGWSCDLQCW